MKIVITFMWLIISTVAGAESFCFTEAGEQYGINPRILKAIAKVESNFNPRAINWNTNGTYDFGMMQINSVWAPALGRERWDALGDPCRNIEAGAQILSGCMKKYGYSWQAIGCYHSQTPDKRDSYAMAVFKQLQQIDREEKKLKETFQAVPTTQQKMDGEGSPRQNRKRNSNMQSTAPVTELLRESADGMTLPAEPFPVELTASSQFEVDPGGL